MKNTAVNGNVDICVVNIMADRYLQLKEIIKESEAELDRVRAAFLSIGDTATDEFNIAVTHCQRESFVDLTEAQELLGTRAFNNLINKGLIQTIEYDRVTVNQVGE